MIPGAQVLARRIRVEVSEVDRAISRARNDSGARRVHAGVSLPPKIAGLP